MSTKWSADCHAVRQAARGIVAHYEGEAWKGTQEEYRQRVDEVAILIAGAPNLLRRLGCLVDAMSLRREDAGGIHEKRLSGACAAARAAIEIATTTGELR